MFHAAHEALAYCLHASLAANIKCSFVEDFRTGVLVISTIDDSSIFVRAIQEPQSLKWSCHFYHADQPNESSCYFRYLLADPCRHWDGTICHGKEASEEEKDGKKTRHASLAACAEHR